MPEAPCESFLARLAEVCRRQPEAIALQPTEAPGLSYGALWHQIISLGAGLRAQGVQPGDCVAIAYGRSPEFVLALLACWHEGAVWTPIAGLPPERRQMLLSEAEPVCILGPDHLELEALARPMHSESLLPPSWVPGQARDDSKGLSSSEAELYGLASAYVPAPGDPAYLIFTSGSTGRPKGVLLPHAGILPMLEAQVEIFALDSTSRSLWLLSPLFDASLSDIGTALLSGATLVIDPEPLYNLEHFYALMQQHRISYIDLPPALLSVLDSKRLPASLATITIGGEVADPMQVKRWAEHLRLINVYGPTEATVCTSAMCCRSDCDQTGLLGMLLPGVVYALDGEVPIPGQQGELWIQSPGLALGYRSQPDLTAQRFVRHAGRRWYRSGDKVEITETGEYRFLGRIDRQFKQQGRLLCPEEVEAALLTLPGIQRAVVLQDASGALSACLQGARLPDTELASLLAERLPAWMIPARWLWPEPWPLTPSGKPDAAALASWPLPETNTNPSALSPSQQVLAAIWASLLKQPVTTPEADFFALGGSSVQVLACIGLAAEAGLRLSPESFYRERCLGRILAAEQSQTMRLDALRQHFPPDLPVMAALSSERLTSSETGLVLLTGATGFLGSRLLAELLRHRRRVRCLVRASDTEAGRARVHLTLGPWLPAAELAACDARLEIVCGDLSRPDLGLDVPGAHSLLSGVEALLHCAAQVDLVRDFASLSAANLAATARLAGLCHDAAIPFHQVSTLSVFVALSPKPDLADEALPLSALDGKRLIHGGYAQSKFAADAWLQAQPCPSSIYRPGLVTGDSRSGYAAPRDWLGGLIRGLLDLGAIPAPGPLSAALQVDITPVDYVAAAILALMAATPGTYHLANPAPLSLSSLLEALQIWSRQQGRPLEVLAAADFRQLAQSHLRRHPSLEHSAALLALCAALEPERSAETWHSLNLFQASGIQLASPATDAHLSALGLVCPPPDQALLARYFTVFVRDRVASYA